MKEKGKGKEKGKVREKPKMSFPLQKKEGLNEIILLKQSNKIPKCKISV